MDSANNKTNRILKNDAGATNRYELATSDYEKIIKNQSRIWELRKELNAIGAFFRNMQTSDMDADEYYGISLCLLRMSRRLGKIHDDLGGIAK